MTDWPHSTRQETESSGVIVIAVMVLVWWWLYHHHLSLVKQLKHQVVVIGAALVCSTIMLILIYLGWRWKHHLRPKAWPKMTGQAFENQIVIWLKQTGYSEVRKTEYFDKGIDIIANKMGLSFGIQVKLSKKLVGVAAVRAAVAGIKCYGCSRAMVITNSNFTSAATQLALVNNCQLVNGLALKVASKSKP